jgi:hypothetical protein
VNDGIGSLKYAKVREVAKVVLQLGVGTRLAKADIKAAYRIVPIHSTPPTAFHAVGR